MNGQEGSLDRDCWFAFIFRLAEDFSFSSPVWPTTLVVLTGPDAPFPQPITSSADQLPPE